LQGSCLAQLQGQQGLLQLLLWQQQQLGQPWSLLSRR